MESDKKNLILAMVASMAIFGGYYFFYERPVLQKQQETPVSEKPADIPGESLDATLSYASAKSISKRVNFKTNALQGSISLKGGRIDDVFLTRYKENLTEDSRSVSLLQPPKTAESYYMESGWVSSDKSVEMPNGNTVWTPTINTVNSNETCILKWNSPQGLIFTRAITPDAEYVFKITDRVTNQSNKTVQMRPFALLSRTSPSGSGSTSYALHEGAIGYLDDKLKEEKYKDIQSEKAFHYTSKGGWFGFSDKYWLGALLPDQSMNIHANFRAVGTESAPRYQTDFMGPEIVLQPGMSTEHSFHLFAGAKSVDVLDDYERKLNLPHFDLAIDFGWFYFITRPLFFVLKTLYQFFGNFALAIVALTLLIRALLFPLASKSYKSMAKMKSLTPELNRIKEQTEGDNMRRNQEMMALYKKHKVNPVSGCLPMVLQVPVLFAIYKVLLISIEMRHTPLFGWIRDMSAPDPTTLFNLFGLIPWAPPSFLMIGALPLMMGFTMYLQQKLSPQPMDEMQTKMFLILPFLFTYMLSQFPAGVVFYWTLTNILAILQQWALTRTKVHS